MKKVLCILISLALLTLICIPCFAQNDDLVVDDANILSDSEEQVLEAKLKEISDRQELDVVVLTVYGLEGKDINAYADDFFDYNGYGRGDGHDGCLFIVDMDTRYYTMSTTGYGITAITDYGLEVIYEEVLNEFKDGYYYDGFGRYGELVDEFVTQAKAGAPYDENNPYGQYYSGYFDYSDWDDDYESSEPTERNPVMGVLISLVVAVIVSLIVVGMVKSSYKPVKFNSNAGYYLDNGSLHITNSYENFLYKNVSRVKIESESSSGHSGGSSTHTSSSGMSHGGGGGRSF